MITKSSAVSIDDISSVGTELHEDELAAVSGGARVIVIVILEACSCAVGGGYDYD